MGNRKQELQKRALEAVKRGYAFTWFKMNEAVIFQKENGIF